MKKRLQNILALSGVASRRASGTLIEKGIVKVDGKVVRERGARFDPEEHVITVRGKEIKAEEKKLYFLFNKPAGVISTVIDTHGRKKVTDFFRDVDARFYPVGRLDKDTTGVMILTNDGELAHRLSHPSFGVEKEYLAVSSLKLDDRALKAVSSGVDIDGKKTAPCLVSEIADPQGRNVYRVRLHEGKKRQIRVMFVSVGAKITELDRTRYAGLSAEGLKRGERRELTDGEIKTLRSLVL
ncbi:MAG: pseudouridine synthase [Candidatus Omnitrophota bacterium]